MSDGALNRRTFLSVLITCFMVHVTSVTHAAEGAAVGHVVFTSQHRCFKKKTNLSFQTAQPGRRQMCEAAIRRNIFYNETFALHFDGAQMTQ